MDDHGISPGNAPPTGTLARIGVEYPVLTIGMRFAAVIDANVKTLSSNTTYANEDRVLPARVRGAGLSDETFRKTKVE